MIDVDEFERKLRNTHIVIGFLKGIFFSIAGYFVGGSLVSTQRLLAALAVVVILGVVTELLFIYSPRISLHRSLLNSCHEDYLKRLSAAIEELGWVGFVRRDRIRAISSDVTTD